MKTMWRGITIIIVAAVLSEVVSVGTYYYIKYAVSWRMSEQTSKNLKELERINNMKARVESAVMATVTAVEEKIEDPKEIYRICAKLVDRNPHIIGSAVALAPEFCSKDKTAFAAFAYQVVDGSAVMTKQLPYDYQHSEWYAHSMEKDTAWWSEPYKDTGGSDMLIYTFSAPIHNQRHECIGVLTGDIDYKEMVFHRPGEEAEFGRLFMWIFFSQFVSIVLIVFIVWRSTKSIRLLNKVTAVQDVMTRELQIASNIQSSMLPVTPNQENIRHQVDVKVKLLSANDISAEDFAQAIKDVLEGNELKVSHRDAQTIVQEYFAKQQEKIQAERAEQGKVHKEAGEKFLKENAQKEGIVTLPSGLQYQVLKEGNGKKPTAKDTVMCHYEGTLIDGTVFDSSYQRGEPATFPLQQVIAGWTEGLQLMQEGAKYRFFIPYRLGYGAGGAGASIPPFAALIFDVELIQVVK